MEATGDSCEDLGKPEIDQSSRQSCSQEYLVNDKESKSSVSNEARKSITLDEFLNMNKDVFGDNIDFQGAEEIPRQVVTNQLRRKPKARPPTKKLTPTKQIQHLEKLKKAGLIVKYPSSKSQPPTRVRNSKPGTRIFNPAGQQKAHVNDIPPGTPLKIADHVREQLFSKSKDSAGSKIAQPLQNKQISGKPANISNKSPVLQKPLPTQQSIIGTKISLPAKSTSNTPKSVQPPAISQQPNSKVGQFGNIADKFVPTKQHVAQPKTLDVKRTIVAQAGAKTISNVNVQQNKNSKSRPRPVTNYKISNQQTNLEPKEPVGHFSCFKKPKESLIPVSEVPDVMRTLSEASCSRTGTNETKTINTIQQPLCSVQETHKKSDAKKRDAPFDVIEKLKKQGLLSVVKKNKLNNESDSSQIKMLPVDTGG